MRSLLKLIGFASTTLFVVLQVAILGTGMFAGSAMASSGSGSASAAGGRCISCCNCSFPNLSCWFNGIGQHCGGFMGVCTPKCRCATNGPNGPWCKRNI